jgi:hypothetical protein
MNPILTNSDVPNTTIPARTPAGAEQGGFE